MIQPFENRRFVVIALLLFASSLWAQREGPRADSLFLSIDAVEASVDEKLARADKLRNEGLAGKDCVKSQVGWALYVKYSQPEVVAMDAGSSLGRCGNVGHYVPYTLGKRNFELERFDLALSLFEIALRGSQTNEQKLNCRRAIGAAAFKLQDFPRAHNELTAAKKLAGDEVPFELNLNLAAVNMSLGFYENALELLNLSESELTEEETYELQFNRFVSLMRLNRQEEASALYAAIADDILARDVDQTKFSNLLAWSLIQQDPEVWLALRAKLEDALSEHNHGILFEPGDPSRLLFRAYDEEWQALGIEDSGTQRWRVVKQLWPAFDANKERVREIMQEELKTLQSIQFEPKTIDDPSTPWWEMWALPGLGLVLMVTGLFFYTRRITTATKEESRVVRSASSVGLLNQLERIVSEYLTDEEGEKTKSDVARHELDIIIQDLKSGRIDLKRAEVSQLLPADSELNRIEQEALALFVMGYNGKQTAVVLDRSQRYIYNMRHRVRIKLGLEKEQGFDAWFEEQKAAKAL